MFVLLLCFLTAFAMAYLSIPYIIKIARDRNLCEEPIERSSHTISTPALGGIGIFCGTIFAVLMWTPFQNFANLQYILCALLLMFLVGLKDDLDPIQPRIKFAAQFFAALIVVFQGGIFMEGCYGLFGVHDFLPVNIFRVLTILVFMLIINGFNLIDGINGLAGSIGTLAAGILGGWFFWAGRIELSVLSFALVGTCIAFLKFNYTPAKTFMGDSGSLVIGITCAILIIAFIDINYELPGNSPYKINNGPVFAISVAILPIFDTVRVFLTRIVRGQPPFSPDRRHIHHLLIDFGFSHTMTTTILTGISILFITLVIVLDGILGLHALLLLIISLASALTYYLHWAVGRYRAQKMAF
ncbi:MAG: MraY family glycosyltransferase [Phaeodactylibacter sp.]|uniref:glycosyltransferase family 4 protein n=1 Tax=Phaeodactylibacter sp. TaxID=1940289 RepID=UPI0032EDA325